jgi:hypothetical protein
MMSSAREHHARAEQLLEEAHATQDQISRRLILAEAQVHATLALSAPDGNRPATPQADVGRGEDTFGLAPVSPGGPAPGLGTDARLAERRS